MICDIRFNITILFLAHSLIKIDFKTFVSRPLHSLSVPSPKIVLDSPLYSLYLSCKQTFLIVSNIHGHSSLNLLISRCLKIDLIVVDFPLPMEP